MKKFTLIMAFLLFINLKLTAREKFMLTDFSIELKEITSAPQHVWVNSGYTTVNPQQNTVMSVNEFFSPPYAAKEFNLSVDLKAGSQLIKDTGSFGKGDVGLLYAGGTWFPHKIVRRGTYHHFKKEGLISLGVTSELIPLFGTPGFMLKIKVKNRGDEAIQLNLLPTVNPGNPVCLPLNKWAFGQPKSTKPVAENISAAVWGNEDGKLGLFQENMEPELLPGASSISYVVVMMTAGDGKLPETCNPRELEQASIRAWENRLAKYTRNIPTLESDIDGLQEYYYRSVLSGLVCIWENDAFIVNPYLATAGMDGGGTCSYLWDIAGYVPNMVSLMMDSDIIPIARQMVNIDLEKYYAYAFDGGGVGVRYSYSPNAFTNLVCSIAKFFGPEELLFQSAKKLILNDEKNTTQRDHLVDYGVQHNLLEMRSTGWEHFVASPNAERVWCLDQLAILGEYVNENPDECAAWRDKAKVIKKAIQTELWDDDVQWFISKYPNGYNDCVYTVQAFDVLRTGVCNEAMTDAILDHLRDGAFLGDCGITSISAEDSLHYEILDTDWSGGGAYTGDGPQLASTLYEIDKPDLAWDVLKRHFWMGKRLIYFPQEHYSDRPMVPAHKRANVVSGIAGAEATLFGLIGLQPNYDGHLWINPHPVNEGTVKIRGFGYKGAMFDIELTSDKLVVFRNNELLFKESPKRIRIM